MQTLQLSPVHLPGASILPPYLEPLARAAERGCDLIREIASLTRQLEFDSFTYWAATRSTELVEGRLYELSTLPSEWSSRYDEVSYVETDPRVHIVLTQTLPVAWDQSTWRGRIPEVDKFLDDAATFGTGSGVCVPMHDPSFGVVRFDFESTIRNVDAARQAEIRATFEKLSIVGRFLHDLFVVAVRRNELPSRSLGMPLSEREVECLALATRGLNPNQIARELRLDVRIVNVHFDSIRAKLGCLNRDEAIADALKKGLVAP